MSRSPPIACRSSPPWRFGGAGTAILAAGLTDRAALDRGLPTPAAISQGDELLVIAIAVCVGVALTQIAISLAVRFVERPRALQLSRRSAWIGTGVALLIAIPIAVAAGLPGTVSDEWDNFKSRTSSAEQTERGQVLVDTSSSGRYQFWQSAARAAETEPLRGIGPGTFEFYWAQDPENFGFVRDAHSLYMENLAELGWVGFGLIVALVLATLGIGVGRSINAPPAARTRIATATAAAAAFAAGAALDWIWEIAALPALFMLLAAVIAIDSEPDEAGSIPARRYGESAHAKRSHIRKFAPQAIGAVLAIIALAVIWFPLQGCRRPPSRARSRSPPATSPPPSKAPTPPSTPSPTPPAPASSRPWSSSSRASCPPPRRPPERRPAGSPETGATGPPSRGSRPAPATPRRPSRPCARPVSSTQDRSEALR